MRARQARVTRGLLAAAVAIFVAALFHVAGGGAAPSALALTLCLAFSGLATIALIGRRLSAWRLGAAVVVSQFLFHLLFGLGAGAPVMIAGGLTHVHPGSHLIMVANATAPMTMSASPTDPFLMWASHAAAALVTIGALGFGERAVLGLFATVRMRLAGLVRIHHLRPVAIAHPPAAPVTQSIPATLRDLTVLLAGRRRRGPPSRAVATA